MKKNKIPKKFLLLDRKSPNGVYTVERKYPNLDMKAIRNFCKNENREYSSLTDKELEQFGMKTAIN